MKEKLTLVYQLLADTMDFLDSTYKESVAHFQHHNHISMFIENRRAELINSIYNCFNQDGSVSDYSDKVKEEVKSLKDKTIIGLRQLLNKLS